MDHRQQAAQSPRGGNPRTPHKRQVEATQTTPGLKREAGAPPGGTTPMRWLLARWCVVSATLGTVAPQPGQLPAAVHYVHCDVTRDLTTPL